MKRTLSEELERIHTLTYGKRVIEEQGLLDRILRGVGLKKDEKKIDDPKKADLVSDDVNEFFKTLEDSSNSGGLSQQKRGSMSFQKGVESMQIGLILLGYELPRYGVDGLFGPETASAVGKFNQDNQILSEAVSYDAIGLIGKPGQGTHNVSDWQSRNAWDVKMDVGASVKSITSGVVSKVRSSGNGLTTSGKKKIYGDQVSVTSSDGPDVFYTHIDSSVSQGQNISVGDEIGKIMTVSGMPPHVHIGLSYGNLSDYISNLPTATGGEGSPQVLSKATPEMLNKLIKLLKERGVTSEDLEKHIDPIKSSGGQISLEGDWLNISKELIRKWEKFTSTASFDEDKYRGGYGSSKKLVNGVLEPVTKDTTWTKQEAEDTLDYELKNKYAPIIARELGMDNWGKLNDRQKASLVSLGYNAGPYFITARSYGKDIKSAIQNNDMELAAQYIEKGPTTGAVSGRYYGGLQRRRSEEAKIFLS